MHDNPELKKLILEESHMNSLSIHPGATKMYQDLNILVARNEARCSTVCVHVFDLPKVKSKTLETFGFNVAFRHSKLEVG